MKHRGAAVPHNSCPSWNESRTPAGAGDRRMELKLRRLGSILDSRGAIISGPRTAGLKAIQRLQRNLRGGRSGSIFRRARTASYAAFGAGLLDSRVCQAIVHRLWQWMTSGFTVVWLDWSARLRVLLIYRHMMALLRSFVQQAGTQRSLMFRKPSLSISLKTHQVSSKCLAMTTETRCISLAT